MKKVVGNSQYQKMANALLILKLLRKGSMSRVAIAKELGLQPSTVTYSVNRLLDAGLVRLSETDIPLQQGPASLGRRAVNLEINRDYGRVVGLELLADCVWASILDLSGRVLFSQKLQYPDLGRLEKRSRFEVLLKQVIASMVERCAPAVVLGVGIALPGIVESNGQAVRDCWTHDLKNCDFSAFLAETFEFPVVIENDANCCVQRYRFEGGPERMDNFFYLLARMYPSNHVPHGVSPFGIGLGLVFRGTLYRGSDNRCGEFISAMMQPDEKGRQLSTVVSRVEDLKDDEQVRRAVLGELVGNLRSLCSVLDPQVMYLGGFLSDYRTEVQALLAPELVGKVVYANAHTDASEGAAVHLLSLFFRIPQVGESSSQWRWNALLKNGI